MVPNKFFGLETSACVHIECLLMTMFHQIKISQKTELLCYVAYRLSERGERGEGQKSTILLSKKTTKGGGGLEGVKNRRF